MSVIKRAFSALGKLGIIIAVAIAFFAGLLGTIYYSLKSKEVNVPNVVGKDILEGERALDRDGLNMRRRAFRYSPTAKPNTILDQSPHAGEIVKVGQTVAVVVSRASAKEGEQAPSTTESNAAVEEKSTSTESTSSKNDNENSNKANKNTRNKNSNNSNNGNSNNTNNTNVNRGANANNVNNRNANVNNRNANDRNANNRNLNGAANANRGTTNANRGTTNSNRNSNSGARNDNSGRNNANSNKRAPGKPPPSNQNRNRRSP